MVTEDEIGFMGAIFAEVNLNGLTNDDWFIMSFRCANVQNMNEMQIVDCYGGVFWEARHSYKLG